MDINLQNLGWNHELEAILEGQGPDHLVPGRVSSPHGKQYRVLTGTGEIMATLSTGVRRSTAASSSLPAVGDWVGLERSDELDSFHIRFIFPRMNTLSRTGPGRTSREQVLAANIDVAFIVTDLDVDFNVRRLERYLSMVHEIGARPVLVLNKADMCSDVGSPARDARAIAPHVPIVITSVTENTGIGTLREFIEPGKTIVLVGSSGVGKSTIINRLLGYERQKVGHVRESDGKGRHITSTRELITLPHGGLLMDNPGIRELQLWSDGTGIAVTFSDIRELAAYCRFSDCIHDSEPGCAVKKAVEDGDIPEERLASYRKLMREQQHAQRRRDAYEKKKHERSLTKMYRHADTIRRMRGKK